MTTPNAVTAPPSTTTPSPTRGPVLIGLSGYANTGKDAAAAALVESGWLLGKFSQPMKDAAYAANPQVVANGVTYRYASLIDAYGIEQAKELFPVVREFQQDLGKGMRDVLGENVWVDAAMAKIPDTAAAVFVDCRFPNEADAIRARDGLVIRINRPGVEAARRPDGTVHISETAMDDYVFDVVIDNDGTLEDLREKVGAVVGDWILGWVFESERAT